MNDKKIEISIPEDTTDEHILAVINSGLLNDLFNPRVNLGNLHGIQCSLGLKDPHSAEILDRGRGWEITFFGLNSFRPATSAKYQEFDAAIASVEKVQGIFGLDPRYPRTLLGRSLVDCIAEFHPRRERPELYCSLGTSLDFDHGTDGFFKFSGGKRITFDLSARPEGGKRKYKANIVISRSRCKNHEMWRLAKEISRLS